jgi:hypothetical protein
MAISTFPKIIRFTGTTDSGDFGNATCPHCGALGRYVIHFLTEKGNGGAMAGCVKLFPVSQVALEEKRLREKQEDYEKKGWKLNKLDSAALEALEEFYLNKLSEQDALSKMDLAKRANVARFKRRA